MLFGKLKRASGSVHINKEWCKGCGFCVEFCPEDVLEMSPQYNNKGYHPPFVKVAEDCNYCRMCEVICPEFSIYVTSDDEEDD